MHCEVAYTGGSCWPANLLDVRCTGRPGRTTGRQRFSWGRDVARNASAAYVHVSAAASREVWIDATTTCLPRSSQEMLTGGGLHNRPTPVQRRGGRRSSHGMWCFPRQISLLKAGQRRAATSRYGGGYSLRLGNPKYLIRNRISLTSSSKTSSQPATRALTRSAVRPMTVPRTTPATPHHHSCQRTWTAHQQLADRP